MSEQYAGKFIEPDLGRLKAKLAATEELLVRGEDELIEVLRRERQLGAVGQVADDDMRDKYPALRRDS